MNFIERMLHKLIGSYQVPKETDGKEQAIKELKAMSDKELDDIGVRRCDIRSRVMGAMGDL